MYRAGPQAGGLPLPRARLGAFTGVVIGVAVLAAFMPIALLFGNGPAGAWMLFRNGGVGMYLLALLTFALPLTLGITGAVVVRGKRVPAGLFFGIATVPLFVALLAAYFGLRAMLRAFGFGSIDPAQMMRINAMGTSEAYSLDIFGGFVTCGCAILGAVALFSAVGSIDVATATRNETQRPSAALGAATLVAGAAWFVATIVVTAMRIRTVGLLSICAVLVVGLLVPLAVLAARAAPVLRVWHDPVEARRASAALLVGGLAGMLAVVVLERAMLARVGSSVLEAVAGESVDASQRARLLMELVVARKWTAVAYGAHGVLGTATFVLALAGSIGNGPGGLRHPISPSGVIAASVGVFAVAATLALGAARNRATDAIASMGRQAAPKDIDLPKVKPGIDDENLGRDGKLTLTVGRGPDLSDAISRSDCYRKRSYGVVADRSVTIDALSQRVPPGCPMELDLVVAVENDPELDARLGDLAAYVHRDRATLSITFEESALDNDWKTGTAVFRAVDDDKLEFGGKKEKLPLRSEAFALSSSGYAVAKFVFRPADKIDFVVRAIASVRERFPGSFPPHGLHTLIEIDRPPAPMPSDPTIVGLSSGMHIGTPVVAGRLPPEVVLRIVRQNTSRFRLCYEGALRRDPKLAGTVRVKFVIDRSGAVATASDAASTLPDREATACIVRGFTNLSFPQPEGGIVVVTQTLTFVP